MAARLLELLAEKIHCNNCSLSVAILIGVVSTWHYYAHVESSPEAIKFVSYSDGHWVATAQRTVRQSPYTYYRADKGSDSTPACLRQRKPIGEYSKILTGLIAAPFTAMIDTFQELVQLDLVQWYLNDITKGTIRDGIGSWMDYYGPETAICGTVTVPLTGGSQFASNDYKSAVEVLVMDQPVSTVHGCDPGFHKANLNASYGVYPCGFATFQWAPESSASNAVSYRNWLRDDWEVDRIVVVKANFMPPDRWDCSKWASEQAEHIDCDKRDD